MFTKFQLPHQYSNPLNITAGPDGALWFTETGFDASSGNRIGRITTAGTITEYPIPTTDSGPGGIVAGPDRALWFTESHGNKIGRITTKGQISEFNVLRPYSIPNHIIAGLNDDLWFNEEGQDSKRSALVRMTTTGHMTEHFLPQVNVDIWGMTLGQDGAVWFLEEQSPSGILSWVGRLGSDGKFQRFEIPTRGAGPVEIASGPNRTLWFTEFFGNNVGNLEY